MLVDHEIAVTEEDARARATEAVPGLLEAAADAPGMVRGPTPKIAHRSRDASAARRVECVRTVSIENGAPVAILEHHAAR